MKVTFMVGEMARLHNISRQALIHYDKIGLFSPRQTDPDTGYRHYSLEQCEDLDVVLSLKQMGMKLGEIKGYLEKESVEERIAILEGKEAMVQEKMREMNRARQRLETIIASLKSRNNIVPFEMGVRQEGLRHILVEKVVPPNTPYELELAIKRLMEKGMAHRLDEIPELFFWVEEVQGRESFAQVAFEVSWETGQCIDAGTYGYMYHKGPYDKICLSRKALVRHLHGSGYVPTGESVERALLDSLAVGNESEYLVEILIPVGKSMSMAPWAKTNTV